MKYLHIVSLCLFLSFHAYSQQTIVSTITHGGLTRDYRLYIPKNYNPSKAAPLVLNLHGLTSNAIQQEFYGDFRPIADTAGFLICHPNGTVSVTTGLTFWNVGLAAGENVDDVGFIEALIDSLSAKYNIDSKRIYSTGMSNGGFMSYLLACASTRFAAIASVTGSSTPLIDIKCKTANAIPIMEIHGTADQTVPYNGTTGIKAIPELVSYWANKNSCNPTPQIIAVPNTNTTDGATAEQHIYKTAAGRNLVEHFKVIGGAHTWPGASFPIGVTCQDFSASREIWRFFSQYSLITDVDDSHIIEQVNVYPNPVESTMNIEVDEKSEFLIKDINGKNVFSIWLFPEVKNIDMKHLTAGIYFFEINNGAKKKIGKFIKA